jgi:hypothetical protein
MKLIGAKPTLPPSPNAAGRHSHCRQSCMVQHSLVGNGRNAGLSVNSAA